jgi:spermidine/putrescine transport system substrate-binding protein
MEATMVYHPRENWDPRTGRRLYSRREFLWRAGALGVSLPAMASILSACGGGDTGTATEVLIGTPTNPVTQPLFDDNPAIESGLPVEEGPLRIYNWEAYINPDTLVAFEEATGVKVEVSTYYNESEALGKLTSGEVQFDIWLPVSNTVAKSVAGQLLQPLNKDYITNLGNVWPELADPYYDKGSQYTVPYVVYQTGIAWRDDMVDAADIQGVANPWDAFWNPAYRGMTGLYDDWQETLSIAMFRAGVDDPSKATDEELAAASESLKELVDLVDIRYTIDGAYTGLPETRFGLHSAWSGDIVNAQYYFPEGGDPGVLRYLWPANAEGSTVRGAIANDTLAILKGAEHPVLAHKFIDFMLDADNALGNFSWLGYQPPQTSIDPETLVADGYVPENLSTAIIRQGDVNLERAYVHVQLEPEVEATWTQAFASALGG